MRYVSEKLTSNLKMANLYSGYFFKPRSTFNNLVYFSINCLKKGL